jgi:hypothetical protein
MSQRGFAISLDMRLLWPWSVVTRYPQLESEVGLTQDDVLQGLTELRDKVVAVASRFMPRPD